MFKSFYVCTLIILDMPFELFCDIIHSGHCRDSHARRNDTTMDALRITATTITSDEDWPELFRPFWQQRHVYSQGRISAGITSQREFRQYVADLLLKSPLSVDQRREVWSKSEKLLDQIKEQSDNQGRINVKDIDVLILGLQLTEPVPRT